VIRRLHEYCNICRNVRCLGLALALLALASTRASADRADELVVAGQELAVAAKYDEAIAKFREADAVRPSALHACLVGLARLRAGQLDEADQEFAACRRRSTSADPVPAWLVTEEHKLAEARKLAEEHRAAAERKAAERKVSAGPPAATRALAAPRAGGTTPAAAPHHSNVPVFLIAGGAGLAVAGGAVHLAIVRPARDRLSASTTSAEYDDRYGRYNAARIATVGLYALGAVALTIGVIRYGTGTSAAMVGMRPVNGGGLVVLGWQR
jgi:hypothetical protein